MQDLRAISKTIHDMGALQPGLPSPIAVPQGYYLNAIDLQDCFVTINLDPKDFQRFSFNVPSSNLQRP